MPSWRRRSGLVLSNAASARICRARRRRAARPRHPAVPRMIEHADEGVLRERDHLAVVLFAVVARRDRLLHRELRGVAFLGAVRGRPASAA